MPYGLKKGCEDMIFYTWKDIERYLLLNKKMWKKCILDIEVYSSDIIINLKTMDNLKKVHDILLEMFGRAYDEKEEKIYLDLDGQFLNIIYEEVDYNGKRKQISPLFNNVLYQQSAYYDNMLSNKLPGIPVIAFHSYKGGVGRTLSLLAFMKAWSSLSSNKKLLIIDSDIEAPGITWLAGDMDESMFSYLDLLEIIQGHDTIEEIIKLISNKVGDLTIKIETELRMVEHIVLPTYRYTEQLLDMYSSPESIVNSYNKKYILAEVFSRLGENLGAEAVLVDLRAGISEFSAPILFDPRVKKYIVTSTSYQSVKGTELLLQQLNKGLPISENALLPEVFLSMVQKGFNTTDIISTLVSVYDKNDTDKENSLTDNLITELPFASELVHLGSLKHIMESLEGRDFYKNIYSLVQNNYVLEEKRKDNQVSLSRDEIIQKIHSLSKNQINAEGNIAFNVLMTQPIKSLIKKFSGSLPLTIIMGAKGSGKTFLYREILRSQYWENFLLRFDKNNYDNNYNNKSTTMVLPLLASKTAIGFNEILKRAIDNFNVDLNCKISDSFWVDNEKKVIRYARMEHDSLDWLEFWKKLLLGALEDSNTLEDMERKLEAHGRKLVFLIDGLEEIFTNTLSSKTEKNAVIALCQELVIELKTRYKNIGCIVFLRKDLARNSIEVNFEQFNTLYKSVELNWSKEEAWRLVVWLVSQAVPGFYKEEVEIDIASPDIIEKNLVKLWGNKLGKANSNEAYASRWILAALSDFNGQLQARDIIRFLQYATEEVGKNIYEDRYIMPSEIKKAVPKCSSYKISEIKQEILALKPILDKLEGAPSEMKTLPFYSDTFNFSSGEEKILKQEGFLKVDNDKYYLPEIVRHALKFKYGKGARPKVLSLILGK